jgi:23S rRNA pseudouridine1911/1915/1917 synthase
VNAVVSDPAQLFEVLHRDDDLLAIRKPSGLVCHPTKGDALSSLVSRVRLFLGSEVPFEMVHRLDRETGGVMVFALNPAAALRLRALWEGGFVTKEYLAIVHGNPASDAGEIAAPLGRDVASVVAIRDAVRPDGARARTRWRCEQRFLRPEGAFALLRVWLDTGRKHQIRIHLAHAGHPIVGDKLYGGDEAVYLDFVKGRLSEAQRTALRLPYHALHAERLWLPWDGGERLFEAPPEGWFQDFVAGRPVPWFADPFAPARP